MSERQGPPELTIEDIAAFKRCRSESFWRACVPMMTGACLVVGVAQTRGFFANRSRLLYTSYFLAGLGGFLGGKLSYVGKCKRMFLDLKDSRVKDMLLSSPRKKPSWGGPTVTENNSPGPLIVETPIQDSENVRHPMTYAERRDYFRGRRPPFIAPSIPPETPSSPSPIIDTDSREIPNVSPRSPPSEYLDQDRPLSSYLFEDSYTPKE